jgi:amino acid adenylation domain-containing protein
MLFLPAREGDSYSRPISPVDWWMLAYPRGLSMDVQICIEGDGTIEVPALAVAVAAASQACPGTRLVRRGDRWVDSGRPPEVRVAQAAGFDRFRFDSPLLRQPLLSGRRPSCEVVLVPGRPATVIFRAHHAVMDGGGTMFWITQVFRSLRGEAVSEADSRLTVDELKEEIAARLGRELPPAVPAAEPQWRSALGPLPGGPRRSMWRRRTIMGTHPAVTAKVARLVAAFGQQPEAGQGLVSISVDLRPYLPGLQTTAVASSTMNIRVHAGDGWQDVHARLLAALDGYEFLGDRANPRMLEIPLRRLRSVNTRADTVARKDETFLVRRNICRAMATVSHVGSVDLASFCAAGFEATSFYSLGSVYFAPEVNIAECRGRTEVTVSWYDAEDAGDRAERLLDWIEEGLTPAAHRIWAANDTARPAKPATLTSLFAEQVRRTPAAVAVSGPEGELTYAQLDQQAAAIAAVLQARGVGRGDRVGLVAGRSAAAIAGMWGIMKAGAAYLPIDAAHPDARINRLLADAGAPACLVEPAAGRRDFLPAGCPGIPLAPAGLVHSEAAPWRDADTKPGDLACVIYTSGSTGAPKGVEIEHGSLVNCIRWVIREAGIDGGTRMPLVASMGFDMAGWVVYLSLLAGGTVLPVREVNAVTLREAIEDGGVTAMAITPSHLELITGAGITRSAVRLVITGGELLRRSAALRALELFGPACRILCQWGPTETAIVNTSHEFDPAADTGAGVPFGRPMDNNAVFLMDERGCPVPPGEPGEAWVAGVQVARGYLGKPELTRERFTRMPDGTRAYRTGDLARRLPSGELAFISRIDDQVKIAGHRIEPAEVAEALEGHPAVRQAAVVPRTRPGREDKQLCGYVVCGPGEPGVTAGELREFLEARLPGYMIPAVILIVPDIPRNTNGKTDVRLLPDPFAPSPGSGASAGSGPLAGDEVTAAVAGIWAQTLQLDPALIDEQADFHKLGGNSILLLSMVNEVSRSVVEHGEQEFLAQLGKIIREPTLHRVCDLARQARAAVSAGSS